MMEDGEFVTVGTALPKGEDDEILSRKPVALHDQVVRDSQGRIRFHGAFTGGFSAGYYNSVDTKQGWVPKTFKSSRSDRNEGKNAPKPEDFMDEEDFGEFGIAPKKLLTNNKYRDNASSRKRVWNVSDDGPHLSLFSNVHLQQCVQLARLTIGQKLLRKLGWRNARIVKEQQEENIEEGFGCALPPGFKYSKKSSKDDDSFEIPPGDICPIDFSIQLNIFGIGYSGLLRPKKPEVKEVPSSNKKKKGIRGQAFGVGALEEEDDDVYTLDNANNYDAELFTEDDIQPVQTTKPKIDRTERCLNGFKKSSTSAVKVQVFYPPVLPRDFAPYCKNRPSNPKSSSSSNRNHSNYNPAKNSFSRGEILNEKPNITSVFELISGKDRDKLEESKKNYELSKFTKSDGASTNSSKDEDKKKQRSNHSEKKHFTNTQANENMTEWEKEQKEIESFPIPMLHHLGAIDDRFNKAQDDQTSSIVEEKKEKSEKEKAVLMNLFGELTRDVVTWHPAKLLCVRFNVEDPYPESAIIGLPTQKHAKFSIFNFLSKPDTNVTPVEKQEVETSKPDEKSAVFKPLAILAMVDLRPSDSETSNLTLIPADNQHAHLQESQGKLLEGEEVSEVTRPPIDIFKAIFEDSDDDSDVNDDEDNTEDDSGHQQLSTTVNPQRNTPEFIPPVNDNLHTNDDDDDDDDDDDVKQKGIKSEKGKHKKGKHKHKKEKHSHKHKKSKKSKSSKSDFVKIEASSDESNEGSSFLSKEDKILLSKLKGMT